AFRGRLMSLLVLTHCGVSSRLWDCDYSSHLKHLLPQGKEAEAVPAESNGPQRKINQRILRCFYQLRAIELKKRAYLKKLIPSINNYKKAKRGNPRCILIVGGKRDEKVYFNQ